LTQAGLETPRDLADIYDAQTPEDAAELLNRPLFTGDILSPAQGGSAICLVQHPCAMRKGTSLLPNLLVCSVLDSGVHRTQWRNHTPTEMPLPGLPGFGQAPSVSFLTFTAANSSSLSSSRRIAVLSRIGVNLLMQRWIYQISRVIIPTITFDEAIAAQHEEADLTMECVDELVAKGYPPSDALNLVDRWLDTKRPEGATFRRQLTNSQIRSTVRKALRKLVTEAPSA
jgi:hypothetical protein